MREYFSHDYGARNDKKLQRILMQHGLAGLGAVWCIFEMLYEAGGTLDISEYDRIAFELRTNNDFVKTIIESDLFEHDEKKFWSVSILLRLTQRQEKSDKARKSVNRRWKQKDTNVLRTNADRNTNVMLLNKNKSKVKEKNNKGFELLSYFEEFWKTYPDKTNQSKKKTLESYQRVAVSAEVCGEIFGGLLKQIDVYEENKKRNVWQPPWRHAVTWLNQECWKNEVVVKESDELPPEVKDRIARYKNNLNLDPPEEKIKKWKEEYYQSLQKI